MATKKIEVMAKESVFKKIPVSSLELDLCNPRLPKSKHNGTEEDIWRKWFF